MNLRVVDREIDDDDRDEDERPFWEQGRWQMSAAFLFLALVIGLGAYAFGGDDTGAGVADSGPVIGGLGPDGSRPQQCRTNDAVQTLPTTAPRDVTWSDLNGAPVPKSASAGPLKTTGPLRWCFAHTPMGAVMAANTIPRQMSGPDWRVVTQQQLVPGLSRDYFESMRESMNDPATTQSTTEVIGFALVSYTPDSAVVKILVRQANLVFASVNYTVDWDGVDWKLRALSTGGLYDVVGEVYSTAGFVMWKES
ncbi:hypothetical protein [Actinoplanes sp. NPDC051851]|uniref:hypothetical protein n=1 Tax=Actinoplanes sp. NPDC051851 TaxID=3154753 RepID=UPI003417D9F6